jgi:hypothetical protein
MIQRLIERFQAWRRWRAMWRKPFHRPELLQSDERPPWE